MDMPVLRMSPGDEAALREARHLLESPGVAAQLAHVVGAPVEYLVTQRLPASARKMVDSATRRALLKALQVATATLRGEGYPPPRVRTHVAAAAASGAAGGAFGLWGLAVELPVTTTLIMRSIAEVARSQGEDLHDADAALACFHVLTMGGRSASDDASESGYFAVRAVLAKQVALAADYVAAHGLSSHGAPVLVQLLASVASRFSVSVGQKAVAQAVPVIGAVSGATLNTLFMRHFQRMAQGHFTVRRLEREYGAATVQRAYALLEANAPVFIQPRRAS